ncbi:centrosome-associated zinc finger protein Cp190 [Aphomia sociella]
MSDLKQVKVDNWGIYFLQRLKHFFNRTDYCDLTLQFQNNAQLKVHRLVLNGCTEYFELLERTCEMYEDCLVMPDDLQADVVVPIVNFMYTGQLEFRMDMLEKMYQTSLVMNMPVLTKLLAAHRIQTVKTPTQSYCGPKRSLKSISVNKQTYQPTHPATSGSNKRSYGKAFENANTTYKEKKTVVISKPDPINVSNFVCGPSSIIQPEPVTSKKHNTLVDPRPTRYELPEELDTDNIFENSFSSISYTSKPLMIHPETNKRYPAKKSGLFYDSLDSKRGSNRLPTVNIVECKKIMKSDETDYDNMDDVNEDSDIFASNYIKVEPHKDPNQLFDQILDNNDGPKVTIESKDKQLNNIDHAKIISEVLKKYPHLMKSNKSIKLKTLNTTTKNEKSKTITQYVEEKDLKPKVDYTYETDVLDSKEAAKLIAMGAENTKGPWICLICGTPGRALHFTSYYKFRRHLVDVHNEKPVSTICEYCGFKSYKRNYMLHHIYTKHGVEPPPQFNFPKCNLCNYVALTEGFLIKHKMSHADGKTFRCNVCAASFNTTNQLLAHIQKTGHKYSADRKANLHCIYCFRMFLRENNLYAHLKTHHKQAAKRDGIVEDSDEEKPPVEKPKIMHGIVKSESFDNEPEDMDVQYQIQQQPDGNIHVVSKKTRLPIQIQKQKILNAGFSIPAQKTQKAKTTQHIPSHNEYSQETIQSPQNMLNEENIVVIDNNEYIMRDNQLIPRKTKTVENEFIISDMMETDAEQTVDTIAPSTSIQYADIHNTENIQQSKMILKKSNIGQPIQIVVSNEEEYKALMSSNHSIIFDNGDANKTLTVLATPHNTTIDTTTMDMDNAQSNDMMIIQDEYPLNVSEGVATDNSNIVVVYSHQMRHVDDPEKQYQIITPQDIGAQYVQSSAMITQNYETVTTTTPVMSAHVIDAQVGESWQNNGIQNEQIQVTTETTLETIVQADSIQSKNDIDTNATLIELPEVQLIAAPKEIPTQLTEIHNALTQPNIIDIQNIVQKENTEQIQKLVIEEIQNTPTTSIDNIISNPPEVITENEINNTDTLNSAPTDNVETQNHNIIEGQDPVDTTVPSLIQQNSDIVGNSSDNVNEENKAQDEQSIESISPLTHAANDIVHKQDDLNKSSDIAEIIPLNESNPATSSAAKEQIQNLASEWSEDEYEVVMQESNEVVENNATSASNNIAIVEETPAEIEESIENIQQEMEKQMAEASVTGIQEHVSTSSQEPIEENGNSSQDNLTHLKADVQMSANVIDNSEEGQEKLTSLLNDWEDNDSQEENNCSNANECEQENIEESVLSDNNAVTESITKENIETAIEKSDPSKDHNIKSLVSDWDDDEDENKD